VDTLKEPLDPADAKKVIRRILDDGIVKPTKHALREMREDRLDTVDCVNVLRCGWVEASEWENGAWRYRVRTHRIFVVVELSLESAPLLFIITAWRIK